MKYEVTLWKVKNKPDRWHVCEVGEIELFPNCVSKTYTPVSPMFDTKKDAQIFMGNLKKLKAAE